MHEIFKYNKQILTRSSSSQAIIHAASHTKVWLLDTTVQGRDDTVTVATRENDAPTMFNTNPPVTLKAVQPTITAITTEPN